MSTACSADRDASERFGPDGLGLDLGTSGRGVTGGSIVGESHAMQKLRGLIEQVAPTDATVLIVGETGTGKELIARAIHEASRRCSGPFVAINCGALSDSLLESELFGHERGAFTGAVAQYKGLVESADGGTLFLDEVATLAAKAQVELLRILEEKAFRRLGGQTTVRVDFRVVAATNERLEPLVAGHRFREDLYYRLNVFAIGAPPLREHPDDIDALAAHFLRAFGASANKRLTGFEPDALEMLRRHLWPGNVRELSNAVERAVVVARGDRVKATELLLQPVENSDSSRAVTASRSLDDVSRDHIVSVLERAGWNITRAAEMLGLDRGTVYQKMKRYGLRRPRAVRTRSN
ncbi:MAG: sigma 54-interacting transcriptional regulator [Deltaproteobacteria bacterium]|nr:sigma 54-interacting transcriptional regulator [Deltaproteobacteria bacterium]